MNFGTRIRTILAVATSLNTALMATDITGFNNPKIELVYRVISIVLNFVIVACVTYYNNDYTLIAAEKTGEMRLEKQQLKGIIVGENFYDEVDEDEEEYDEEEEEIQE